MTARYYEYLILTIFLISILTTEASAQVAEPLITVTTDKSSYVSEDTIVISGSVKSVVEGTPLTIQILDPDKNIVLIYQIDVAQDGKYTTSALGALLKVDGTYTVKVQYGPPNVVAETYFEFSGTSFMTGTSSDGSVIVEIESSIPETGQEMTITVTFTDVDENLIQHINYGIIAIQDGREILSIDESHEHSGVGVHTTSELDSNNPIDVLVTILGIGLPGEEANWTGPLGDIISLTIDGSDNSISQPPQNDEESIQKQIRERIEAAKKLKESQVNSHTSTSNIRITRGASTPGCEETNSCFIPYTTSIGTGGEITWTNDDTAAHTVTSGKNATPDGTFDSSLFGPGKTFSHKFDEAGTFNYFCMVHPWMTGVVVVDDGIPNPTPITIAVSTDKSSYNLRDTVTIGVILSGVTSEQNIAISVTDPTGNNFVSRTVTTDSDGNADLQFRIPESAKSGTYQVIVTSSVDGTSYQDSTQFTVRSQFNVSIVSVQATDQQGNPVSVFSRGTNGFVKVVVSSESNTQSLITVNLFDSDLTSLGIGSFKTTLSPGESEMILSFFIPNDAVVGSADIYANAFSDWPSNGGTPLTRESSSSVEIR